MNAPSVTVARCSPSAPRVVRIVQSVKLSGRTLTTLSLHEGLDAHFRQELWALEPRRWEDSVRVHRHFPHVRGISPQLPLRLARCLRRSRPDIVHTHGVKADTYGLLAARLARVPVAISTCHRSDPSQEPTLLSLLRNRIAWQVSDCVVCISDEVKRHLQKKYRLGETKLRRIYVGVDLAPFSAVPEKPPGTSEGRRVVLCTCHLRPEKNHAMLLKAFARIAPDAPDVDLWLAGLAEPGWKEELAARCAALGIEQRVRFVGPRRDVADLLRRSVLLAHPTRAEALGRSLIEASAAARPVVATRVGGIAEVILDGETGMLFDPDDSEGFARGMAAILRDPALAHRMGARGREHVMRRFALGAMVRDYRALYDALLKRKRR